MNTDLTKYGFTAEFANEAAQYQNLYPAKVISRDRDLYKVVCESGVLSACVSGRLFYGITAEEGFPAVGDFVTVDRTDTEKGNAVIHNILTRKSVSRQIENKKIANMFGSKAEMKQKFRELQKNNKQE
jgi:ribosome biogenesis GTPase